jgi:hypothetical protein
MLRGLQDFRTLQGTTRLRQSQALKSIPRSVLFLGTRQSPCLSGRVKEPTEHIVAEFQFVTKSRTGDAHLAEITTVSGLAGRTYLQYRRLRAAR